MRRGMKAAVHAAVRAGATAARAHRAGLVRRVRARRTRVRRTRGRRLRRALAVLLVLLLSLVGAAVVAYRMTDIPEPHPETAMQSTVFVDSHGEYLGRRGPVDRQEVPLSQVPRHVQEAVIAAENRSFRTDTGIAPTAIARAALAAVTGGAPQGGSTITQQYVKNALLSPEQTLSRKAREALIAVKLDRTRSKDEILQGYLNTVYFGRGAAGIQAAARNYFGVDAKELTVSQGAALASIVNIPSYYEKAGSDPEVTAKLVSRWEWVLDAMSDSGAITAAQRGSARFPAFRFYPPGDTDGQRQYLIDAAAAEAADRLGITQDELARGGYTVHTTFDLAAQNAAAELVADAKPSGKPSGKDGKDLQLHTSVVALVPGDGAVRVLYGGADYARQPFNEALDGAVEAGTALEPFAWTKLGDPLSGLPRETAPTPLRLASAWATAAAHGTYATPYTVGKITRAGHTVYTARPRTRSAMEPYAGEVIAKYAYSDSGPPATHTGGAGTRTLWQTTYDEQLTVTVALFAQHPAEGKLPARTAQLPSGTSDLGLRIGADVRNRLVPSPWGAAIPAPKPTSEPERNPE
ncbi:transglycosylase domain-containing protein [Streptomyces sp. NBC_00038]|uniref:transglycosylase domain-containing protein n=1 Tax=Streptomyces sp. NBC_00038 TaxID=2903615 RepID=UPI002254B371|nr:transglycosylase domain-containing protein [Streptomyces sp. NBC_00038]MCX5559192.1 penicillin-binding protein [Streptomyces sp. NBC_00038]